MMNRLPKIGDKVCTVGQVVDILNGCCGPIVAVQFPHLAGRTVDLFWKKVRKVG
jgi:hypothetical protein